MAGFGLVIQLIGTGQLARSFAAVESVAEKEMRRAMKEALLFVAGQAQKRISGTRGQIPETQLGVVSATLRRRIAPGRIEGAGRDIVGRVGPQRVVYAAVHEFGATIRPVRAPRLIWKDRSGHWHSASQVRIPARPYLAPALEASRDEIVRLLGDAYEAALRGPGSN